MKIVFTGDINFRERIDLTYEKSLETISEIKPYFDKADFVIPNLECPLAKKEKHSPIKKAGPNLICDPSNICFLKALNTTAVTLANNHIGDYGDGALEETLELLKENNIGYAGAGKNIDEAYNAFYIEKDSIKIAIISVCENEFGIATKNSPGSAGYNTKILYNKIKSEKELSDYVIVVFHGGNEFNPLPSPDTQNRYRMLCDMGADAVIAGHTHCPQGYEIYNGKTIIYSMGNFLFKSSTERHETDSWHYGYITILDTSKSGILFETVPYKFNTNATKITVFEGDEKKAMVKYIENLSDIIKDENGLKNYFKGWAWCHKWCPELPKDEKDFTNFNPGNYDLIKCEAHLSQLKTVLEIYFNEETNFAKEMEEKITKLQKMPI